MCPIEYLENFDVVEIKDLPDCYYIILHRRHEVLIRKELNGKNITF